MLLSLSKTLTLAARALGFASVPSVGYSRLSASIIVCRPSNASTKSWSVVQVSAPQQAEKISIEGATSISGTPNQRRVLGVRIEKARAPRPACSRESVPRAPRPACTGESVPRPSAVCCSPTQPLARLAHTPRPPVFPVRIIRSGEHELYY